MVNLNELRAGKRVTIANDIALPNGRVIPKGSEACILHGSVDQISDTIAEEGPGALDHLRADQIEVEVTAYWDPAPGVRTNWTGSLKITELNP